MNSSFLRPLIHVSAMLTLVAMLTSSCTEECASVEPRLRVINRGSDMAFVQLQSTANSDSLNELVSGSASDWITVVSGDNQISVMVEGSTDTTFTAALEDCFEYTITISDADMVTLYEARR